jgi:hypothetical protein
MKDDVMGLEEFLIKYYELLESKLSTCTLLRNQNDVSTNSSGRMSTAMSLLLSQSPHNQLSSRISAPEISQHETELQINDHEEDIDPTKKPIDDDLSAHDLKSG